MKKTIKRVSLLLFVLCLVFTFMPVSASASSAISYFNCDVTIQTTRGKTVNLYKNITDSQRYDYFDQGQTAYSTKGARASDGSTWYQIQAYDRNGNIITVWLNAGSSGVKIINNGIEPSLSFSPSNLSVDVGASKTVSINFEGDGIQHIGGTIDGKSLCDVSWGNTDWNRGTTSLTVTGKKAGNATITVNLMDENSRTFYSKSFSVTVNDNRTFVSASPSSLALDLANNNTGTVRVDISGPYGGIGGSGSGNAGVKAEWIDSGSGYAVAKFTATKPGTADYTFNVYDDTKTKVIASTTIRITVAAPTYTVSYDANGGSGAPSSQTKQHNETLTLSSIKPVRSGYAFKGWATSSGSSSISYQPGSSYYSDNSITLYAVWEKAPSETDITDTESTLAITPTSYPTGTLTVGSYYSLEGTVTSNYAITSIKAEILTSSGGSAGITKTVKPNVTNYSLYDSDIDVAMAFNTLSAGTYKLKFTAMDASGKTETWQSGNFTVKDKATNSTLNVNVTAYPKGTLTVGSYYSLQGTVASNYKITSIKAEILTSSGGSTGITKTVKPNVTSYSLYDSDIDVAMTFNTLSAGTYKLKFTATDASGKTETWQSGNFTVEDKAANSTLKINATAYPKGTLTVGSYYSLQGTVTSNYKITSIKAEILTSSGGSTGNTKTVSPNANSYSLFGSAIDSAMKFNTLSAGTYYLKYTAKDSSGKTVSWTSPNFILKKITVPASSSATVEKAISQMETWAADNRHGYTMDANGRWGQKGDYDCSAAVISAWQLAGVKVKSAGATYTGNMYSVFTRYGFVDVTSSVNLSTGSGLQRGDVLLNIACHTAMYCGNGKLVQASCNEFGGAYGGKPGDQTGKEFAIGYYYNYPWDRVLRYMGN